MKITLFPLIKLIKSTINPLLWIIILIPFITSTGSAQSYKSMMNDNSVNFYDVVKAAESYFDGKDKGKGSGWKGFQRWVAGNEYKYYPSGNRSNIDPYFAKKQHDNFDRNNSVLRSLFPTGWKELGPTTIGKITGHYSVGMGRIVSFYIDPNNNQRFYLGSRTGGFWKSEDGGNTWSGGSTDYLAASGVNTIDASPSNSDSILINVNNSENFTSHGIYRSIDGGNSWFLSNFNPSNLGWGGLGTISQIYKIKYHPTIPNLIFIGTSNGLYRSTDNLATWETIIKYYDFTDIDFHPTNDNIIYAYSKNKPDIVYVSTDEGVSFSSSSIPNNNSAVGTIATSKSCPDCVYFCSDNGLWKSTDSGVSFSLISNPGVANDGFAVSDLNDSNMLAGYVDASFSTDGGLTFNQVTYWSLRNTNGTGNEFQSIYNTSTNYIHADLQAAECLDGVFYACTDGFLVKSIDNGTNWEILSEDIAIRMNYNLGVSQSNHYRTICGSQDNGTSINTEDGWIEMYGGDGMEGIIHPLNDDWMIGSAQYGSRKRTTDGGQSYDHISVTSSDEDKYWIAPMLYDPNNQMRVYSFGENIHRSDDFGSKWTNVGSPSFSGIIMYASIAENNSDIIAATSYSYIELSTDGGTTWNSIKGDLPSYSITDVVFDPNDDSTIIVTYARYVSDSKKVFITHNQGKTWSNITYNLENMPVLSVVIDHTDASTIYLGTEIGVYKKAMADTNWSIHDPNLPNSSIYEMEIVKATNTLRASTWGRGLWEYTIDGRADYPAIITTEISNTPTTATPKEGVDQFITSTIEYNNTLTNVYAEWSIDSPTFGNIIPMSNITGNQWQSNTALPNYPAGTKMFFKVFAVGSNGDTTETYKFQYTVIKFSYCEAFGDSINELLYLSSVSIDNFVNNSQYDDYTHFKDSFINLEIDSTYSINLISNSSNDTLNRYGVWIDYNNDAVFDDNELIFSAIDSSNSVSGNFTVPIEASTEDTLRMRVKITNIDNTLEPCGITTGEIEDYSVVIKPLSYLVGFVTNTICFNDSIIINGTTYNANNASGQELFTNVGTNNSDSLVVINLTILPAIDKTINNNFNILSSSQINANYQWLNCNNDYSPIALETKQSFTVPSNGDYAVEIAVGSCVDTSYCESVWDVSITNTNTDNISIYPNPTNGMLNIDFGENSSPKTYTVSSILGKIIETGETKSNKIVIDLSRENKGIYVITINSENKSKNYKIILQ